MKPFAPIAIVGQACILPGANSVEALWRNIVGGASSISSAPASRWGLPKHTAMSRDGATVATSVDRTWSDAGGYVSNYVFDAQGFQRSSAELSALDPLFHWVLGGVRETLQSIGGIEVRSDALLRAGLILGNLSFPSSSMTRYAEDVWLSAQPGAAGAELRRAAGARPHALNRFSSGMPAHLAARVLVRLRSMPPALLRYMQSNLPATDCTMVTLI
jgi:hypothetical protein